MKNSREMQLAKTRHHWSNQKARKEQLPPEGNSWDCFLFFGGRGAGKTRAAAEWLVWKAITNKDSRWAIIAPTFQSCINVCVEGESGMISVLNRYKVKYEFLRSRGVLILENGSSIYLFSAEQPERMRGPQFHGAWFDELASFTSTEIYELALPALRLGTMPQHIITTTPKPIPLILNLAKVPNEYRIVQKSTTFDNEENLAPGMIRALKERHGNSKYALQELYGEILSQMDGALFSKDAIDDNRSQETFESLHFYKIVIGVDPAVTFGEEADMTGIVVIGQAPNGHCYVIEDATMRGKPEEWAAKVNELSNKYSTKYQRALVVAESNNGGEMISSVLKIENPELKVKLVNATKGKSIRAEPISIAYSKGLVHHLGIFPELELEMLYWIPGKSLNSPNRLDALVWAVTELVENPNTGNAYFLRISNICVRCGMPSPKSFKVCHSCLLPLIEDS